MKRRRFLSATATAGLATATGGLAWLNAPRRARAAWGTWPERGEAAAASIPEAARARSVLELHVNGGMSCFDTFYTVPEWGEGTQTFAHLFGRGSPYNPPAGPNLQDRFAACAPAGLHSETPWVPFGASDGAGNRIYLGPWIYPFWSRPDVLNRMRIVVERHDQVAHEGANPISFTGDRLGSPRMAGVGASIQQYFQDLDGLERVTPHSYILFPQGYSPFNAAAATTIGFHKGNARPLAVSVEQNSVLQQLLSREHIQDPEAFRDAIAVYRDQYAAQLRSGRQPLRSSEWANFAFADRARHDAQALQDILSSDLFAPIAAPDLCGTDLTGADMPSMQTRMAASLLTRETDAARYVMWIDAGIRPSVTGGHDTHAVSITQNGLNLPHTFAALLDIIRNPDNPRPGDEQRISLDETMVVINTEFGRSPTLQGNNNPSNGGTNHWPHGYVNIFIGGPVGPGHGGRSVYGHMDSQNGVAQQWVTPAHQSSLDLSR